MNTLGEYILHLLGKEEFITQWINGVFKEKPIVILGENGTGKTRIFTSTCVAHT